MAEKAVSDIKDSGKELLEKLSEMEVFRREDQGTVARVMEDLSRAPAPKQMAVGGVAGWAAGYVTMKAGKMAATAIGGTLILLQIAHHKGYIKVKTLQFSGGYVSSPRSHSVHLFSLSGLCYLWAISLSSFSLLRRTDGA